jgi:HEPN domain-containing protein
MTPLTREWVRNAEGDLAHVNLAASGQKSLYDGVCFHCQQAAEKYLKALLQEAGLPVPKTHSLLALQTLLLPRHPNLTSLRRGLNFMTRFAVEFRYPGHAATKRQAQACVRWAGRVRTVCRTLLGLKTR